MFIEAELEKRTALRQEGHMLITFLIALLRFERSELHMALLAEGGIFSGRVYKHYPPA